MYESTPRLNIATCDLGSPAMNAGDEHDFRSHRQQQPGPFANNLWPSFSVIVIDVVTFLLVSVLRNPYR